MNETIKEEEKIEDTRPELIKEGEILAKRIESANEEAKRLLEERTALEMNSILGGKTTQEKKEEPKEMTPREYVASLGSMK